ncbi:hypothetical protein AB5I41_04800 [Sphingomonas sp. MMS24-JH45]
MYYKVGSLLLHVDAAVPGQPLATPRPRDGSSGCCATSARRRRSAWWCAR